MKKRQPILLSPPLYRRIARASLSFLLLSALAVTAHAQTETCPLKADGGLNRKARTKTWSVYAEGGTSWATGVWYPNVNAKRSYKLSPATGVGIDFTIRPWVRVGAEYLWSRYRREQRMSVLNPTVMPVKAYGNYAVNYHNFKLGGGLNLMEFWSNRKAQWFNVWLSLGVGYMMARGNEYGIWFSNTRTQNGETAPINGDISVGNESNVVISSNVKASNEHSSFRRFYIPASLHVEVDLSNQLTVGLKGEMDWLLARKSLAPKQLAFALATVRYNFSIGKAKVLSQHYGEEISVLNDKISMLRQQVEAEQAHSQQAEAEMDRIKQEKDELQKKLDDCSASKSTMSAETLMHLVQFDHNSSYISEGEQMRLIAFAQMAKGRKLSLVAEASTPGAESYNRSLSERRMQRVVDILIAQGFAQEDLTPQEAIGEDNGIATAEGRRVTITVK